jgi:DNA-binding Lrp family transcriptional regulator
VARALAEHPFTGNVAIHAGGRNILFELMAPTQQEMSRYVLEQLDRLDGIRAVRTHPVTGVYGDGSKWRLGVLSPKEEDRLRIASRPDEARYQPRGTKKTMRSVGALTPAQRQVTHALEADPRMTIKQLGQALGVSPTIARHRLEATLRAQPLIRCQMAPHLSGWPVRAIFFLNCPADRIEASAQLLSRTPHVRAVFHTVGPHNLYLATSLRSLEDIGHLEAEIVTRLPHVTITDRSFEMRLCKSIGIVLDDDGLLARRVPFS